MIEKIISGGQTGADRAALDVAIKLGIPHGGWISKGRKTEDGKLPTKYALKETPSIGYTQRTEMNVVDSEGTLIVSHGRLRGDAALTQKLAKKHNRPCFHLNLKKTMQHKASEIVRFWIDARKIKILNVAGSAASNDPKIYKAVRRLLQVVITAYLPKKLEDAVEWLITQLPLKEKVSIATMRESELQNLNDTFGEYIRRRFGLLSGNKKLLASCSFSSGNKGLSPEGASSVIIKDLWDRLRETHKMRPVK
ncbi:MAG: putative molybdenum carrier protein [Deltaproteobacteria bacterium]|nr:putative molybdenum carrier protein [Deltaproteobacteria bacterium]